MYFLVQCAVSHHHGARRSSNRNSFTFFRLHGLYVLTRWRAGLCMGSILAEFLASHIHNWLKSMALKTPSTKRYIGEIKSIILPPNILINRENVFEIQLHCKCLQGIAGTLRGVFCNICRENPVIFTDLQNLQGKSVHITGFSLQIFQKTPAESLQFPANICSVLIILIF